MKLTLEFREVFNNRGDTIVYELKGGKAMQELDKKWASLCKKKG
jgi:hypothetical protein